MSAVYKRLGREDSFITPYTAHKTFTIASSSFSDSGIKVEKAVSGSFPYTEESLRYAGIEQILINSELRYSSEYADDRVLGSSAFVLDIPKQLYGEAIKPNSVSIQTTNVQANQFDFDIYDKDGFLIESSSGNQIGYINYTLGLGVFTSGSYASTAFAPVELTTPVPYTTSAIALSYRDTALPDQDVQYGTLDIILPDSFIDLLTFYDWTLTPDLAAKLTFTFATKPTETREVRDLEDVGDGTHRIAFSGDPINPAEVIGASIFYFIADNSATTTYLVKVEGAWPSDIANYIDGEFLGIPLGNIVRTTDQIINVSPASFQQDGNVIDTFSAVEVQISTVEPNYTASFQSSVDITTYNFHCIVEPNEFNFTHNPTVLQDASGSFRSNITGSDFRTYATSVGIYNSADELLAVGKLAQPTPMLPDTPYTFVVQLDL